MSAQAPSTEWQVSPVLHATTLSALICFLAALICLVGEHRGKWKVRGSIDCQDILSAWEASAFICFVLPLPLSYLYISVLLPKIGYCAKKQEMENLIYRTMAKYMLLVHRAKVLRPAFLPKQENTVVPLTPQSSVTAPTQPFSQLHWQVMVCHWSKTRSFPSKTTLG